jgi:hypothetical protein
MLFVMQNRRREAVTEVKLEDVPTVATPPLFLKLKHRANLATALFVDVGI